MNWRMKELVGGPSEKEPSTTRREADCQGKVPQSHASRLLVSTTCLQILRENPPGAQSPQTWILPLPNLLGGHCRASNPACVCWLSQTWMVLSHLLDVMLLLCLGWLTSCQRYPRGLTFGQSPWTADKDQPNQTGGTTSMFESFVNTKRTINGKDS